MFIGVYIVSLGSYVSGLMSNSQILLLVLLEVGECSGDCVWVMLIWDDYQELLDLFVVDMCNSGSNLFGMIIVGCFLLCFVGNMLWVYFDIVGISFQYGMGNLVISRLFLLLLVFLS